MEKKEKVREVRKSKKHGIIHVKSMFNNTIITIKDLNGNVLCWSSAGTQGFKGSRKSSPFAAQQVAEQAARRAIKHGIKRVHVKVIGNGEASQAAIKAFMSMGLKIISIKEVTPLPHNGCRPPKRRRI